MAVSIPFASVGYTTIPVGVSKSEENDEIHPPVSAKKSEPRKKSLARERIKL